jgi:hypothetical protein
VLALVAGLALLFLLPHPWNGVGFAAAMVWEIVGLLYGLWWSKRQVPLVGTSTLLGLGAVVVEPCTPWGEGQASGRDMASTLAGRRRAWSACSRLLGAGAHAPRRTGAGCLGLRLAPEQPGEVDAVAPAERLRHEQARLVRVPDRRAEPLPGRSLPVVGDAEETAVLQECARLGWISRMASICRGGGVAPLRVPWSEVLWPPRPVALRSVLPGSAAFESSGRWRPSAHR